MGVWAIGSLVRWVGLTGHGTGPRTGGAELSEVGPNDGDVGVGTMRVDGSGYVVGGSKEGTGVGVLFSCRRTLLGT